MKQKLLLVLLGLLFTFFAGYAQEICDNGIDDDGDTFIDIADPDCAEFYGLTFSGENADCSVDPPDSGIDFFSLGEAPIQSSQNTVDDQSKIVVGDVDGDGIPDAVATTRWGFQLTVFATTNGQDDGKDEGDEKSTFKFSNSEPIFNTSGAKITPELEVWIADIGTFDASGNFVSDTPDGIGEIFGTGAKRVANGTFVEDYFFVAFTYQPDDLVPIYEAVYMSQTSPGPGSTGFNNFRPGIPGITDFDGDGKAEIYLKNRIYAAETGFLLADGGGSWTSEINSAPVAANIIKSSNSLELICGNLIYDISSVNLTNRTPASPTILTPTLDMNTPAITKLQSPGQPAWTSYHPRIYPDPSQPGGSGNKPPPQDTNYSSTSVADVNNDGTLDVFISGALDTPNGFTAVFYWDIVASTATAYEPIDPDDATNWAWGTGIVNLKDLDGDAKVEANFVAGDHLFALEESGGLLIEMWTSDLKDALSGIVATTVYDFENDGRPEIVVRDSKELRMHDGLTGVLVNSPPACESHTLTEGPIVVDINGDGDTDICVSCFTGPGNFKPAVNSQAKLGGINLFNSTTSNWLPTRRVWNQGPYFVVNIRDDLSVPFPMGDQTTIFGSGVCDNGLPGPQRPLNMFLNQTPSLGPGGCPIFPAPDIAFGGIDPRDPLYDPNLMPGDPGYIPPTIEVIPPVCGELEITVNFNITNNGSLIITDDIPVSFWAVDPTDPSVTPADRLHTEILSVVNFQIGEILQFSNIVFNSTGEEFILYIVLNDEYATTNQADLPPFLPLTLDDPDIQECDINNNIFDFPIVPQPFVVQTTSTPNVQCDSTDPTEPENGTITAVVFEGGVETLDYGKFGFQWYAGNDTLPANAIPGPQGTKRLLEGDFSPDPGVADGLYTLVVTNLTLGCQSLPLTDTVALDDLKPDITLNLVSHQTQCERPPDKSADGAIDAVITGGPLGAIWEFNWVDDNLNPYNITTQNATGLSKGIYILEVTLQGSSCIFNSEPIVVEGPEIPDPVAITLADADDCSAPNGQITAQALISGVPQDTLNYEFIWRESDINFITNGTLLDPVAKNPTRKGLDPGYYVVQVVDKNTGCESAWAITEVGNQIKIPVLTLTELAPQTSCDLLNPNGRIQVDVLIDGIPQNPADLLIEWFRGDNTIPPLHANTSGINGEIAEGVDALVEFTVRVTSAQNCEVTDKLQITESKPVFAITAITMTPNSTCDPALASSPFTGALTVDEITIDGVPTTDYTGLTFTWYEGNNIATAIEIVGETTSSITQREDMDYLVLVTQDNTTCASPDVLEPITAIEDLPVIDIVDIPETTCAGTPNGQLTAGVDVGGPIVTAGYTFTWYDGLDTSDPSKIISNTTGSEDESIIELEGGMNYSVVVVNNTTGCTQEDFFFLGDQSKIPTATAVSTPNAICDPALTVPAVQFGGTATATILIDNVAIPVPDYANYTFTWYAGPTTGDPVIAGETTRTITNQQDGVYTFVAQNNLGCSTSDFQVTITKQNITITPTLIIDFQQSSCDPLNPNGQLTASALSDGVPSGAGYSYQWYVGNSPLPPSTLFVDGTDGTISGADGETILDLAANTYGVLVTDLSNGCQAFNSEIIAQQLPVIDVSIINSTPNTICDPALTVPPIAFNGSIEVAVTLDGAPVNPVDWEVTINGTSNDLVPVNSTNAAGDFIFEQIDGGNYDFTAQRITTGPGFQCISPVENFVLSQTPSPLTAAITIDAEQTSCGAPNGQLTAAAAGGSGNYTYEWFVGGSTTDPPSVTFVDPVNGTISGANGEIVSTLAADTYAVLVTDLTSGCQFTASEIVSLQLPVITVNVISSTPNTICDPALTVPPVAFNGSIQVDITMTSGGVPVALNPGDWEVTISGTTNDLVPVGPTTNPAGDYIFTQLDGGNYDFTAQRINPGIGFQCISPPRNFVLSQTPSPLTASITIDAEQTSCGIPNGQLTAAAAGGSGNYTYEWFVGGSTTDPPSVTFVDPVNGTISGANGEIVSALAADTYAILVTDQASGCQFTASEIVSLQLPVITVSVVNSTPNTICDPALTVPPVAFNGSIEVNITMFSGGVPIALNPADWEVTISGTTNDLVPVGPTTNAAGDYIFTQLDGGNYDFTAQRINPGIGFQCISPPENFVLGQTPSPLTAAITIDAEQTSCGAPNGQLTAAAAGGSGNYTYEWFVGGSTTDPPSATFVDPVNGTISGVNGEVISALAADTYAVLVTDLTSGCQFTASEIISQQLPVIDVSIVNSTPNTICDPALTVPPVAFNGSIEVDITLNGAPITPSDWEVTISGTTNDLVPVPPTTNAAGDFIFTQLDGGNYDFTAQRITTGVGFQCISPPENFVLSQTPSPLTAAITIDAEQTSCGAPNGQLTAAAMGGSGNYTYEWFVGGSTTDPPSVTFVDPVNGTISGVDGEIISALAADTYAVLVTDLTSGCQFTASEIISQQLPIIDVTIVNSTPNTICDPLLTVPPVAFNGSIEVDITLNGAPITPSDWEVTISGTTNDLVPVPPTTNAAGDFIFTQLDGGNYDFTAQRITTGVGFQCISPPENFVLSQTPSPLTAAITIDAEQTSCGAPNGQLTAAAAGGSGNYTYEWFVGGSTTDPPSVTFVDPVNGTISGVDGEIISALASDTYAVLVTDLTSGCQFTASEIISQQLPIIDVTIINFTANSICDPALTNPAILNNGSIEVDITLNGAPITPSDWEVTISGTTNDLVPVPPTTNAAGDFIFTQLDGGNYDFTAQRINPGVGFQCVSPPENFVLTQTPSPLSASLTIDADQTSCDALNPNGQLTAAGVAGSGNYQYDWFIGGSTTDPPSIAFVDGVHGTIAGASGEIIQDIDDNTYAVLITDLSNGCQTTASEIVSENLPVIVLTLVGDTPNSICDPALTNPAVNYNGSLQISVTLNGVPVTPADWELTLSGMTNEMVVVPPTTNAAGDFIFTQLDGGNYDVTAQRVTAGVGFQCISPALNHNLPEVPPVLTPVITIDQDQTSCGAPNGELSISTTTVPANIGGYAYQWFKGNSTNPGDVFVDGVDGTIKPGGAGLLNVAARKYTVIVTDLDNGCQILDSEDIIDDINDPFVPAIPASLTPNTICDIGNSVLGVYTGAIEVNVEEPQGSGFIVFPNPNYEFIWHIGEVGSMVLDQTIVGDPNYTQLASGKYTVIIRNTITSCESNPQTFTVVDNFTYPDIALTPTSQTSCSPADLNGEINMSVLTGGIPSADGYSYDWYVGNSSIVPPSSVFINGADGVFSGPIGDEETIVSALGTNYYTVIALDQTTGCTSQETIFIGEAIVDPILNVAVVNHSDCSLDGSLTPSITNLGPSPNFVPAPDGFIYHWYKGMDQSGGEFTTTTDNPVAPNPDPELSTANGTIPILYSGYYTVQAEDIHANCLSEPETIFIDRPPVAIDILFETNFLPSVCNDVVGIVTAWVDLDGNATSSAAETDYTRFTFQWFVEQPTDPLASYYTEQPPVFLPPAAPSNIGPDNSLDVNDINLNNPQLYPANIPVGAVGNMYAPDSQFEGATLYGRKDGRYTVVVFDNVTGCKEFLPIDLPFAGAHAEGTVTVSDVSRCDPHPLYPDGNLTVNIDPLTLGAFVQNDFEHLVYLGNNPDPNYSTLLIGFYTGTEVATRIGAGIVPTLPPAFEANAYTVVARNLVNGCFSTPVTVLLDSAARQPVITEVARNDNSFCLPSATELGDGFIEVAASLDPDDNTTGVPFSYAENYTFSWTYNGGALDPQMDVVNAGGFVGNRIENLPAGDYVVTVSRDETLCEETKSFTIYDQIIPPEITAAAPGDNTGCDPWTGTIFIQNADITPVPVNMGLEYSFKVVFGGVDITGTTTTVITAADVTFSDLEPGTYYIEATRIVGASTNCPSAPFEVVVETNPIDPSLSFAVIDPNTACDPGDPDGVINLDVDAGIEIAGGLGYTIEWFTDIGLTTSFQGPINIVSAGPGDPVQDNLVNAPDDDYYVRVINPNGCITVDSRTIQSIPDQISITGTTFTPQQYCDMVNPQGVAQVTGITLTTGGVTAPDPNFAIDYTYRWYSSITDFNTASAANFAPLNGELADSDEILDLGGPGVASGTYYVVAIKDPLTGSGSGCTTGVAQVDVTLDTTPPDFDLVLTQVNDACDPLANPNAVITGNFSTTGGPGDDLNAPIYTITWNGVALDPLPTATSIENIIGPNQRTWSDVQPGTYTAVVTNSITNCTATASIEVVSIPEPIVVTEANILKNDLFYCTGAAFPALTDDYAFIEIPDAAISPLPPVPPGGIIAQYTFQWYKDAPNNGPGIDLTATVGTITPITNRLDYLTYPGITEGSYFVVITRNAGLDPGSGCESPVIRIDLGKDTTPPDFDLVLTQVNNACDPLANPNAVITGNFSTTGGPGDDLNAPIYTITWNGVALDPLPTATSIENIIGPNQRTWSDVQPGTYTAVVTNSITNCTSVASIEVTSDPEPIVITDASIIKNDLRYCDLAGSIVPAPAVNDYVFIEVPDAAVSPGVVADYTFQWFKDAPDIINGTDITATEPLVLATDNRIDYVNYPGITSGTYYFIATRNPGLDPGSGCETTPIRVDILEDITNPVFDLVLTQVNDACDPLANPNSIITGTFSTTGGPGDDGFAPVYTITWNGVALDPLPTATSIENIIGPNQRTWSDVQPGTYTAVVTNSITNCTSVASIEVTSDPEPIVITDASIIKNDLRYCDLAGSIVPAPAVNDYVFIEVPDAAVSPGVVADYTFQWFKDAPDAVTGIDLTATEPLIINTTNRIDYVNYPGITSGTYYFIATRNPGLDPGSGCETTPIRVDILEDITNPVFDLVLTQVNDACDPLANPNSIITGTFSTTGGPGDDGFVPVYTITWNGVALDPLPTATSIENIIGPNQRTWSDVQPGTYTAVVTNSITNCTSVASIEVTSDPEPIVITDASIIKNDLRYCDLAGSIVPAPAVNDYVFIEVPDAAVSPGVVADYTFQWFKDAPDAVTGIDLTATEPLIINTTNRIDYVNYPGITSGTYYFIATRNPGLDPGSGCETTPIRVDILEIITNPVFDLVLTQVNDACDPLANPNSIITGTFSTTGGPGDDGFAPIYTITWNGVALDPLPTATSIENIIGPNQRTWSDVQPGTYTAVVTNSITNCTATASIEVVSIPEPIVVTEANILKNDLFYCTGAAFPALTDDYAFIEIPDAAISPLPPVPPGGIIAQYTFQWYKDAPNNGPGIDLTATVGTITPITNRLDYLTYPGITEGSYFVVITRNAGLDPGSGCESPVIRIDLGKDTTPPDFDLVLTQVNNACDPLSNPNAVITGNFSTTGGPGDDLNAPVYTITWNGVALDPLPTATSIENIIGPNQRTWSDVQPGTYTAVVTNSITNCTATASIEVVSIPEPIVITEANIIKNDLRYCDLAGSIVPAPAVNDYVFIEVPDAAVSPGVVADYTFQWFKDAPDAVTGIDLTATEPLIINTTNRIDYTNYPGITSGTYYFIATRNPGLDPGSGCETTPIRVDILEDINNPVFDLVLTQVNDACDNNWNSEITATFETLAGPGADGFNPNYEITWTILSGGGGGSTPLPSPDIIPSAGVGGTTFVWNNIEPGEYQAVIRNTLTNCTATASVEVVVQPAEIVLNAVDYNKEDLTYCLDPLSLVPLPATTDYAYIEIATISPGNRGEYTFSWYLNDPNSAPLETSPGVPITGPILDYTTYPTIADGLYYVVAQRNAGLTPGSGCESSPLAIEIFNEPRIPEIIFTATSNNACDLAFANGELTAAVTINGNSLSPGSTFSWFVGPDIASPPFVDGVDGDLDQSFVSQETLRNISPGVYTVLVFDAATGCDITRNYNVDDLPSIPNISLQNITVTPQDICDPSGAIIISDGDISIGGNPGLVKDFLFSWSFGSPINPPLDSLGTNGLPSGLPIDGPIIDASIYEFMGTGEYYVTIKAKMGEGAGCPGPPQKVTVDDISTDPQIDFVTTPNSTCPGGTPNGVIVATVQEIDGTTTDPYTYTWTVGGAPVDPLTITDVGNTSTVIDAVDGDYSLTVFNANTGCSFTRGFSLILDRTLSEPNIIRVDKIDPIDCNPTARMEVVEIQLGGQPANVGDFEYRWYADAFDPANIILTDPLDPLSPPVSTPNLENVAIGKYFVTALELNTNCESLAKEVNILDVNIIYPIVEILQDSPQTSCDPAMPNGQLSALADGAFDDSNSGGNYTFTWFDVSSTQIGIGSTIADLGVGIYSVEVRNNITGCTATTAFIVEDGTELSRLQVSLSTEPVTFCDVDNGVVEARISNHNIGNWEFTWSGPNGFNTVEAGNTSRLDNVEPGTYTASAIDLDGNYCPSLIKTVVVEDQRVPPPIDMIVDSQLTNCYIDQPNGQITASAGGTITGFEFNWYTGTSVAGSVIGTNNIISNLPLGSYTVEIIDRFTKCGVNDFREIEDATVLPPTPGAEVLNNLTDCLNPDGALEIVYDGNPTDYDFFWYDGSSATGTPANTETTYSDLDLGDYTTTVMDLTTGCVSEGLTVTIEDERVFPEFETKVTNANCETSNGIVELQFDTDYGVRDVIWYDEGGFNVGAGQILLDQPTGDYTFEIVTFKNCEAFGAETIGTEITNYNGISANNDGSNDGFQIDCITLFPNNNVKIFNRAGVKVYEADGYNNDDIIFEGLGLEGIYLAGQDLPDGTYFYVIDKGDGSRPVTGYLELIR